MPALPPPAWARSSVAPPERRGEAGCPGRRSRDDGGSRRPVRSARLLVFVFGGARVFSSRDSAAQFHLLKQQAFLWRSKKSNASVLGLVFLNQFFSLEGSKIPHDAFFKLQTRIPARQHPKFLQDATCKRLKRAGVVGAFLQHLHNRILDVQWWQFLRSASVRTHVFQRAIKASLGLLCVRRFLVFFRRFVFCFFLNFFCFARLRLALLGGRIAFGLLAVGFPCVR